MRSILFLGLFIAVFFTSALAQKKQFVPTHYEHSLLWEVSGKGLKAPSYLFGTYHLAGKSLVDSLPIIRQRFEKCSAVAGEILIDSTAMQKVAYAMMMPDNSLDKIFTAEEYKLIADRVKKAMGADMMVFNHVRPAAVQLVLSQSNAQKTTSASNEQLDTYFQTQGKKRNEKVIALETVDDQISYLFSKDLAVEKKRLLVYVSKPDTSMATYAKMYKFYLQQDLNGLYKMMMQEDDSEYTQQEKDALFKDRNIKWVAELPAIIAAQPTFIAVGAAHLLGSDGLIDQLRLKGYTVKAVLK